VLAEDIHVVTLSAVTDSVSCGGSDSNWGERMCCLCRKVRGKFGQSEPRGGKRGYSWHQVIGG